MSYISIRKKKCKCGTKEEPCKLWPDLGYDGYAKIHAPQHILDRQDRKAKDRQKKYNKKLKQKVMALKEPKAETEQELWYLMQMHSNERVCDNCGLSLAHYNDWAWRGSQHHIIDKSPTNGCPSIACHPLNNLVLGYYCCHGQWHTSYMNAAKMPVFEKAKEKFLLFKSAIIESELKKIPTCFYELL